MTKHTGQLSNLSPACGSGNRFGIIQLSDLQFGVNHTFGNPSKIAEGLLSDIQGMSGEYYFTPLYIVISGDITETAHSEEFKDAARVIEEILNGLNIDRANILCVPGNHDVNWEQSKKGNEVGDNQLKFQPYNEFVANITQSGQGTVGITYPLIKGDEWDIEFLLLNSCEKIDRENTSPWICKEKLKRSLVSKKEALRIVIVHHSLNPSAKDENEVLRTYNSEISKEVLQKRSEAISNMEEVKSLIEYHKCDIVLTGHTHSVQMVAPANDEGHSIIYSRCGATGVNKRYRADGIPNQYGIHVIDCDTFSLQSIWRAFNPLRRTENGLGGWIEDGCFATNPTKYSLPGIVRKGATLHTPLSSGAGTVSKLTDSGAEEKPKDVDMEPSEAVATNLDKMKIAIANLLGGWNENA